MDYQDIVDFLKREYNIVGREQKKAIIYPTICHNLDCNSASHKLYLYKNESTGTPIFYCYTDCAEAFNIYQLIQKYEELRGRVLNFKDAYYKFHGKEYRNKPATVTAVSTPIFQEALYVKPQTLELPLYNENILKLFPPQNATHPWALEGIDLLTLKKFEVYFSASYEGVIIPHRDLQGRLIGIRIRTYNEEKMVHGKYMPLFINNVYCRHPLSLNLFGLFQNQANIAKAKKVILVESEKAVLQAEDMFGSKNNITLAVCGSSISNWQLSLLVKYLGVEEVIVAFDKEYKNFDEWHAYQEHILRQLHAIKNLVDIKILWDKNEKFSLKESPFDRTLKDFYSLEIWRQNEDKNKYGVKSQSKRDGFNTGEKRTNKEVAQRGKGRNARWQNPSKF